MTRMLHSTIAAVCLLACSRADARPLYLRVYQQTFPVEAEQRYPCHVCHAGDRKSILNAYGQAFNAKLPGKNVKDADEIRRILQELGPHPGRPMK